MANGSEVGQGHVSIFPVMTGFRSTVLKEIQGSGDEGSSLFSRIFKGVGSKTGSSLGRDLKSSFDGSTSGLGTKALSKLKSEVSSASRAMSSALLKQQDAAGSVRVAQAKLNEAVAKYGEGSSQAIAASERLASAQRREQSASQTLTTATERLKAAKQAVANMKTATVEAPKTSLFTAAIDRIKNSVRSLNDEKIDNLSTTMDRFSVKWGVISGVAQAGAQRVMSLFSGMGQAAMDASDSTDKFKSTLTFAGVDNGAIEKLTQSTQKYADQTVYDIADIRNVTAQLAANGVKGYGQLTEAAGNLNAVAGGNAETFKSVGMVLTQTAGAGKLTTENWNQLADAIPGASGKLQEAMRRNGAYTGNFRDAMEKGQITAEEFNQAIMDLGMTDAAEKAAQSTSTFEGAIGNWQAAVTGFGQSVLTALKPQLTGAINWATGKLSNFTGWFTRTWDSVSGLVSKGDFAAAFQKAFHIDDRTMTGLLGSLDGIRNGFKQIIDAVAPVKSSFTDANSGFSLVNRGVGGLTSALQLVQPVLPLIANLIKLFEGLPQPVQTGIAATVLFGGQMKSVVGPVSGVINILKSLTGGVGKAAGAIGDLVSNKLGRTQALTGLSDTLSATASSAEDATGGLGHASRSVEQVGDSAERSASKTASSSKSIGNSLGGISLKGAAVATGVVGLFALVDNKMQNSSSLASSFSDAMKGGADSYSQMMKSLQSGASGDYSWLDKIATFGKDQNISDTLKRNGLSFDTFKAAVEGSGSAYDELKAKVPGIMTGMGGVMDAVDKLRDSYKQTINSMIDYSKTQEGISSAGSTVQSMFSTLSTTLKANGDNLANNNQLTDASKQAVQQATDALMLNVQQQLAYGQANGTVAQSTQAAKNEVQQMRDQLIQTLTQTGMSQQAAEQYADSLGLIPGNVGTTITENANMTKGEVEAYLDTLGLTPKQKTTVMNALTDKANGDTNNLHVNYKSLPKEVKSLLTANNTDAVNKSNNAHRTIDAVPTGHHTAFGGDANGVSGAAGGARGAIGSVPKGHNTGFGGDANGVAGAAASARGSIRSVSESHTTTFSAVMTGAWNNVKDFFGSIPGALASYWGGKATGGLVHRATGGPIQRLAGGGPNGYVRGPGTTTSDSIPTFLSDKEYVVKAASARRIGIGNLDVMNRTGSLPVTSARPVSITYAPTNNITQQDPSLVVAALDARRRRDLDWLNTGGYR